MAAKRTTTFSMRMPDDLNERIQAYATEHSCTKAEAMSHFARAGIELEDSGPSGDSGVSSDTLDKIHARLEALQNLPTIEPEPTTAIVPADIKDKIQAYSTEHDCTEHEALTYYARIGVQMSGDQRPSTVADVAELSRRLDALAQDNAAKTEQMKQMAEALYDIREYTKPDVPELEGELAEDVEEHELTEEERQRIADEHTRQIVSDVMDDYLAKQREADEAREARERAEQQDLSQRNTLAMWVPVLVAIIVSLIIGLVILLLR